MENRPADEAIAAVTCGATSSPCCASARHAAREDRPFVSVVVPLEHNRGQALPAARSWVGQDLPGHRFEIIFVGAIPAYRRVAAALRGILQWPHALVDVDTRNTFELYQRGAERANGRYLLFSEGHCVATPGCLVALAAHLARKPRGFVNLRVQPVSSNAISRADARVDRRSFAHLADLHHWTALSNQAFAISREAFFELGGFPYEFEGFSWMALALRAAEVGLPIAHVDDASVEHFYRERLMEIGQGVAVYVRGELAFRASVSATRWKARLGEPSSASSPSVGRRLRAGWELAAAALRCHRPRAEAAQLDAALIAFIQAAIRWSWLTVPTMDLAQPRPGSPWTSAPPL